MGTNVEVLKRPSGILRIYGNGEYDYLGLNRPYPANFSIPDNAELTFIYRLHTNNQRIAIKDSTSTDSNGFSVEYRDELGRSTSRHVKDSNRLLAADLTEDSQFTIGKVIYSVQK